MERGHYIVIEGHDGTGKTTQANRLERRMTDFGRKVMRFDEPGGTPMADQLRADILEGPDRHILTEATLYQAARIDNWYLKGEPALDQGTDLLASRSYKSTEIYQGKAGGVGLNLIRGMNELTMPSRYLHPSKFLLLVILDEAVREERLKKRVESGGALDVIERRAKEYQRKVANAYLELAQEPGVDIVDASGTEDEVEALVWDKVKPLYER